jgi:hypothetical protein
MHPLQRIRAGLVVTRRRRTVMTLIMTDTQVTQLVQLFAPNTILVFIVVFGFP